MQENCLQERHQNVNTDYFWIMNDLFSSFTFIFTFYFLYTLSTNPYIIFRIEKKTCSLKKKIRETDVPICK